MQGLLAVYGVDGGQDGEKLGALAPCVAAYHADVPAQVSGLRPSVVVAPTRCVGTICGLGRPKQNLPWTERGMLGGELLRGEIQHIYATPPSQTPTDGRVLCGCSAHVRQREPLNSVRLRQCASMLAPRCHT